MNRAVLSVSNDDATKRLRASDAETRGRGDTVKRKEPPRFVVLSSPRPRVSLPRLRVIFPLYAVALIICGINRHSSH
jgi:hypothetical protein